MTLSSVIAEIDRAFETEQIPWLTSLVNQPSYTGAPEDVEAAAAIIEFRLREIGMTVERVPAEGFADHRVYATNGTGPDDTAVLLAGHCDTVYPREQGFLAVERDADGDTIRGPGVLDMKGGLSVVVFALQALQRAAPDFMTGLKLRFVCNTDEEVGSPDSRALYERLATRTSHALVFEGGREGDGIITARKGTGGFCLEVQGRAAHAGNQHADGVNAIHALSLLIPQIEQLTDYDAGTTVNVGTIQGGSSKNTVPAHAACNIDVRVTSASAGDKVVSALTRLTKRPFAHVADLPERFDAVKVTLQGGMRRPPMEAQPASAALRRQYESCAQAEGLGIGEAPLQGGGSDANLLAARGVACIDGLGPYGQFMHNPKEWSSLSSLHKRTRALARFLHAP